MVMQSNEQLQIEKMCEVFQEYLAEEECIEIVYTEKMGYLHIAKWMNHGEAVYEVKPVNSASQLCQFLLEDITYNYLEKEDLLCIEIPIEEEHALYQRLQRYFTDYPEYQFILTDELEKMLHTMLCSK